MPARTGEQYISGLKDHPAEVYIRGERVKDVTTHPAFRSGIQTVAKLLDMQHDPKLRDEVLYGCHGRAGEFRRSRWTLVACQGPRAGTAV